MSEFLIKLFVKDNKDVTDADVRGRYGNLTSIVGIVVNVLLFAMKFFVGTLTRSVSIIGDAVNNLSDAGSSVISFISFKISKKPADREHPFGHARVEYIGATIIAVIILFIGLELLKSSVEKILNPEPIMFRVVTVVILAISIVTKLWLYFFNKGLAKRINSSMMQATAVDSLSDVLATSAVLVSTVISPLIGFQLDGFMGIAVTIFIVVSGIDILKDTAGHILGLAPSDELITRIEEYIEKYDNVLGMHDLMVHSYGPRRCFASVHVEVNANEDILISHDLIDNIERDIAVDYGIHLVIHLDPLIIDDPIVNELHRTVEQVVAAVDETLSIHDFRVVKGTTHSNLIFDVMVSYQCNKSDDQILSEIIRGIDDLQRNLYAVVTIDRSYLSAPNHKMQQ